MVEDNLFKSTDKSLDSVPFCLWRAAFLVALQSFLFGYIFSCMNSCLVTGDNNSPSKCFDGTDSSCPKGSIYRDLQLSDIEAQLTTTLGVLGAWFGSLFGNYPAELWGRKPTLTYNCIFFLLGAGLSASGSFVCLFLGRIVSGVGVGTASVVAPMLLAEIAADNNRGTITTLCQVMVTLAIFTAALVSYFFVSFVDHGWQYVLGLGASPAVVFLLCIQLVPESPKWLVSHHRPDEAFGYLQKLRHLDTSGQAITNEIQAMLRESRPASSNKWSNSKDLTGDRRSVDENRVSLSGEELKEKEVTWSDLLTHRKPLIIGCGLMFFQGMTGINTVIFYSTTIFSYAGFSNSLLGTLLVTLCNVIFTLVCTYLIDKMGRKTLLTIGGYIMLIALIVLSSVLISLPDDSGSDSSSGSPGGAVAVVMVLVYIIGFAIGLGAVVWVLMSEIIPTKFRAKAMSLFLSINWGTNCLIGLLTITAINSLGGVKSNMDDDSVVKSDQKTGVAILYYIFAFITVIYLIFLALIVPETRSIPSLEPPLANEEETETIENIGISTSLE